MLATRISILSHSVETSPLSNAAQCTPQTVHAGQIMATRFAIPTVRCIKEPAVASMAGYVGLGVCSSTGTNISQCGSTPAHCNAGCISGCTKGASTTSVKKVQATSSVKKAQASSPAGTAPRDDGRCGKDFGGATCDPKGAYGGCCS